MPRLIATVLGCAVLACGAARAEWPAALVGAGDVAVAAAAEPNVIEAAPLPAPRPRDLSAVFDRVAEPARIAPLPPRAEGVPDDYKLAMLIRTSLIALNQANQTGNYSVLRDLGSPAFHRVNNPARLAEAFANLRLRGVDLQPILVVEPKIAEPYINERGMLRLKGFFPTRPEQVNFELAFVPDEQEWRLFAISVTTSRAVPVAANAPSGGAVSR